MPLPGILYQPHHHYYFHRYHHHFNAPHAKIIVQQTQFTRRVFPKRPGQTTRVHYQLVPNHWKETDMAQVIFVIIILSLVGVYWIYILSIDSRCLEG